MIKKVLLPLFTIIALSGCGKTEKAQETALLDSVQSAHEKVMGDDDINMKVRGRLKQLLAKKPELKDSVDYFLKKLDDNDNVMMDWMNKFNPDFTGKSHEQIMTYLNDQKKQVMSVDSLMKSGTKAATGFILKSR